MYKQLRFIQIVLYLGLGILFGALLAPSSWAGELISADEVAHFALIAVGFAFAYYVPQIVHELMKLNDQLAGRSPELHSFLSQPRGEKG